MRVVVTGHTGLEKAKFLQEVQAICQRNRKRVAIHDLEDLTLQQRPGLRSPYHLELPRLALLELRRKAFEEILRASKREENTIIHFHATYRNRGIPFSIVDTAQLKEFGPQLYIVLIDDVYRVKFRILDWVNRMKQRGLKHGPTEKISLRELMEWRAEEVMVTQIIADNSDDAQFVPLYVVALRHGPEFVYQLIFEGQEALGKDGGKPKVYASFPISKLFSKEYEHLKSEVETFRRRLKAESGFIIFDPWTIDERKLARLYDDDPTAPEIKLGDDEGNAYSFDTSEVLEIREHLTAQVPVRDWQLIDQSDLVIAYRPAMSGGVRDEISYANRSGKIVYAIWPSTDEPPGDLENPHIDMRFETLDELLAAVKRN